MSLGTSSLKKAKGAREQYQAEQKVRSMSHRAKAPDEKGYTWSMGYNNCVGRYSPGGNYSRFGGSSLNRKKQNQLSLYEEDLHAVSANFIKMALKATARAIRIWGRWPAELLAMLLRPDTESQGEYRLWLSQQLAGDVVGAGLGVHMLSARSRGKIKDKATAFFRACPGSRVFCTLTFIDAVDDRSGVSILNKFLTSLRKKFGEVQFLWVAERQKKNVKFPGNIHFHIILNKRLPVGQWNALWALQQYNAGLVGHDKYDQEITKVEFMEQYTQDVKEKFKNKRIQGMLNPLDIKRVKSIGGLAMYLTKYITKQDKDEPFGCAAWHCSRRVSRMFVRATVGPSAFAYLKSFANFKVDKDTGECWPALEVKGAFFVMVYVNDKTAPLRYLREMETVNRWLLEGHTLDKLPQIDDGDYTKHFVSKN